MNTISVFFLWIVNGWTYPEYHDGPDMYTNVDCAYMDVFECTCICAIKKFSEGNRSVAMRSNCVFNLQLLKWIKWIQPRGISSIFRSPSFYIHTPQHLTILPFIHPIQKKLTGKLFNISSKTNCSTCSRSGIRCIRCVHVCRHAHELMNFSTLPYSQFNDSETMEQATHGIYNILHT